MAGSKDRRRDERSRAGSGDAARPAPGGDAGEAMALLQGTLDVLVLQALRAGERHGYDIARWIAETTDAALQVEEGALYTALHRMEKRRWLAARWGTSERGRRAKYYRLTESGERQLGDQTRSWDRYVAAVAKVLGRGAREAES